MLDQNKISVALVDDSAVIRSIVAKLLKDDDQIEITASVSNGQMGIDVAKTKKPDIMILDVEMPVMDGLSALPEILKNSPKTKVIMFSSLTAKGADTTIKAMSLGAVECLVKPSSPSGVGPGSPFQTMLLQLIKSLARKKSTSATPPKRALNGGMQAVKLSDKPKIFAKPEILAIGSSTGGPQALFQVISDIGEINIPIVITQHMPETFTKILAQHISQKTNRDAQEASDGMPILPGKIYVAPGGKHLLFEKNGGQLVAKLDDGPQENFCKPAVDPMLRSLVKIFDKRILCAILTGMGQDGLLGAQEVVAKGGNVIAQDEPTSVVWGMPGAVATKGICSAVLPLNEIGKHIKSAI